jgi:hypothetical protein
LFSILGARSYLRGRGGTAGIPERATGAPEPVPKSQPPVEAEPPAAPKPAPEPEPAAKTTEPLEPEAPKIREPEQPPAAPAKPAPEDPQRGVRDALARIKQKIAEADQDVAAHSKDRSDAAEKVRDLHQKATTTSSKDPGRADLIKELNAAQRRLGEINERHTHKVQQADQLRAARDRLQNALNEQTYGRPSFRSEVEDAVWQLALKEPDGSVLSPSGTKIKPGDPWVMGHKPKYEFWKHQRSAAERAITREQFIRECNSPEMYRPETKADNESHAFEDKSDAYLGP